MAFAVVLADGAGSKAFADIGSRYAAQCVGKRLAEDFENLYSEDESTLKEKIIEKSLEKIKGEAEEKQNDVGEFSATLLFVAISQGRYIAGNLGDGVIGFEKNGAYGVMFHPIRGEFANQTFFITHKNAAQIIEIKRGELDGITGFVLMTDGVSDLLYSRRERELSAACLKIQEWLRCNPQKKVCQALENNIKNLFREKTGDDCSLAVVGKLSLSNESLRQKPEEFQSDFLGCCTKASLNNRLSVIEALAELDNSDAPIEEIGKRTKLSGPWIKRHLVKVRELIDVGE